MINLTFNDKELILGGKNLAIDNSRPPLPANTIRLKYTLGATPSFSFGTYTQISADPNIWELYSEQDDWRYLCFYDSNLLEVIDANLSNVIIAGGMFKGCKSLTDVHLDGTQSITTMEGTFCECSSLVNINLFDTSSVVNMSQMFYMCSSIEIIPTFDTSSVTNMSAICRECISLRYVPLFDTTHVTNIDQAFLDCVKVESGARALYQQASTQAIPPVQHDVTFQSCGVYTVTGAAELAQIPQDWGGTAAHGYEEEFG